eukprot:TRINITY_DN2411_c1_g1_i6.p1 TRINITY_DN2411_c1_g1~~TRINITY_DN2411_c1_g1_i6.p1  ORF type:complete len:3444 (+),score=771.56 TRINITY_DN2411_c1_g1_i6:5032-15363(+)
MTKEQCQTLCTNAPSTDCIGVQYTSIAPSDKSWISTSGITEPRAYGREQILGNAAVATGCPKGVIPWQASWVSASEDEILSDLLAACEDAKADKVSPLCCGSENGGKCTIAGTCKKVARLVYHDCPSTHPFPFILDTTGDPNPDDKYRCCTTEVAPGGTCPNMVDCSAEPLERMHGSWKITVKITYKDGTPAEFRTYTYWGAPDAEKPVIADVDDNTCASGKVTVVKPTVASDRILARVGCKLDSGDDKPELAAGRSFKRPNQIGRTFLGCYSTEGITGATKEMSDPLECQAFCAGKFWTMTCPKDDGSFTCRCVDQAAYNALVADTTKSREPYMCFNQRTDTCPGGVITSDAFYAAGGEGTLAIYGANSDNQGYAPCAPFYQYPTTRCELIMQGRDQTDAILESANYVDFKRNAYFNSKSYTVALKSAGTLADSKQTCYRKGFKYQAPLPRMSIQVFGPGTSLMDLDDKRDASSLWDCFPDAVTGGSVIATRDRVDQGKYYAVKITVLEKSANFPSGVKYTVQQQYTGGGATPDATDALLGCSGYGEVDPHPQCTPGFACPAKCGDITFNSVMLRGPEPCSASTLDIVATSEGLDVGICSVNMGCGFFKFDEYPESIISGESLESGMIKFSISSDTGTPDFVPSEVGWKLSLIDCHDKVVKYWTSTSTTLLQKIGGVYSSDDLTSKPGSWFPDGYLGFCEELTLEVGSTTHSIQKAYQKIIVLPGLPWEVHIKEDIPACIEACDPDIVSDCEPLSFSAVLKTKNGMVSQTDGVFCMAEAGHFDASLNDYVSHSFSATNVLAGTTNEQGEVSFKSGYTKAGKVKIVVTCACSTCRPDAQQVRFQSVQGFVTVYPAAPASISCTKAPTKALAMDRIDLAAGLQDVYKNDITERAHGLSLTVSENGPGTIIGKTTANLVGGIASWSIKTDKVAAELVFSMGVTPPGLDIPTGAYSFRGCLNDFTGTSILDTGKCTRRYRSFAMTPAMCAKKCAIFPTFIITSEDDKKSQLCICSREANIVPAYGAANEQLCMTPGCAGDTSGLFNTPCGGTSPGTDHRYLAVYKRETAYPLPLNTARCPATTIYPNRAYRLELADQPCKPNDVGMLTGDYNQRCMQGASAFDCPQAAVGQSLTYVVHVKDAGGNLADVNGDYAECAHPSTPRVCGDEVQLTSTPEGGEITAQGVCSSGYPDNVVSLAISGFVDTKGRVVASVPQSTKTNGRILTFRISSTAAQCVIATAEANSGLMPSQTSRKICFHAGPISDIVIVNPPETQAALGPFPLMTANVFDRYENLVKWSTSKLGIFPFDDGAPPLSLPECGYGGKPRKLNSLVRIGARFADGTGEAEPFKPTAQLRDGVTSFGGFAYSAVERGLDTACFRLRLQLKRSETPSVLGCPAGSVSDELIQDLNLQEDEYITIDGMSSYIPILGPKLVIIQPTSDHIVVTAGEIFNVAVSIELADGTQCWTESNCQIELFSVSMEYVSGPSADCPKCGRDVQEDGRITKFNNMVRYIAGTYTYNYWGNAGNARSPIGAPAPFRVTILPGKPEKLRFKNCIAGHKAVAGDLFNHALEVLDAYNNPTTSWQMDITLSAAQEVTTFFGSSKGALYQAWSVSPPTSNLQGSDEAAFTGLSITKASKWFLMASSLGLQGAECRIQITPAQPDNCRAFTTDFSFEVPHPFWKAGDDFKVRVQFFDIYSNPITEQLSGGFEAKISLIDAQAELQGETSKEIMGQSVVFTTRYLKAPETIRIAAEVPGSNVLPCEAPELPIVAADPCCLAFTEVKEMVNGDPTKLPLAPIMGPESGNSLMSPLRAGEEFCATVVVQDTYGNVVDETDPAIRALYQTTNEFSEPSGLFEDTGCEEEPVEEEFDFPDFGGGDLFGGFGGFSLFGDSFSEVLDVIDTGSCTPPADDPTIGADPFLDDVGFDADIIDPTSNLGVETSPAELPPTFPNRRVTLSRKRCASTCVGDDELGGITTYDSANGVFPICGITYNRAECIFMEATSKDLVSAISPKICISHAPWAKLSCSTETRLVAQGQPFKGFTGLLTDAFGNSARTCTRDGGSCAVTIRELAETTENGYICCGRVTDPELTPGELTGDGLTVSGASGIAQFTDDMFYSRGRPAATDPLRLELVSGDGTIRAQCGKMTVLGVRIVCDDAPSLVLAGEEFNIIGSVIKRVNGQFTPIACPGNENCDTKSFAKIMTGGWVLENSRFAARPAAAGDLPATCAGKSQMECDALDTDCLFGMSKATLPFGPQPIQCNLLDEKRVQEGIAAVGGIITFSGLTYYRSAVIKPEITPRSNSISTQDWLNLDNTDEKVGRPPGDCDEVIVAPAKAYEMCMGTKTGTNPVLQDKKFSGTPLVETTNVNSPMECKRMCSDDRRCQTWSFAADHTCSLYEVLATPPTEDSPQTQSGCKDDTNPACIGGMRSGACTKCKTTGSPSDGSCGACPAKKLVAGQPLRMGMRIHDMYGNEIGYPATVKAVVSCKVTAAEPDRNPDFTSRLYPNRVSRVRATEVQSQVTGLNLLGSVVTSQSTLHVAGAYRITCWADTEGPEGVDSGLPDETSSDYPGGVVWTPVVSVSGATLNFDIGTSQFGKLHTAAYHNIIRRRCPTCSPDFQDLYIRVRGKIDNLKQALTDDFSLVGKGQLEVYPTFKDAVERTHGWPMDNCIGKGYTDKKIGFPGFCSKEDTGAEPKPGNWGVTGAIEGAGYKIDEDLIKLTVASEVVWYIETTPGCSPRQGMPAVEYLRDVGEKAVSFDDCVSKVKTAFSGMDGREANGASWTVTGGFCYGVFTSFAEQISVTQSDSAFTCDFPRVNDWDDVGCACEGHPCPCSAPPRSNENLRKECGVMVVPASPDHLKCLSRAPDVFAGQDTTIHVAVRDAFGNRVISAKGVASATFAGNSAPAIPAKPQAPFESGVARLTAKFTSADDVQVYVDTDLPLPNGGLTSCPASIINDDECEPFKITCPSTQEKCCAGKRPCPGVDLLAVCPADLDHVVFITQPSDNIPCQDEDHIVSEIRMPPLTVQVRDKFGNNKILTPITVSVLVATGGVNTPTGTLRGIMTKSTVNGQVTFDDLSYDVAEKISLRIEAIEKYAIIAQKTLTYEVKSTNVVNVCPGDICQLHEISAPKTCTFDVPNEDVIEIEARDRAGNLLRAHQVADCRITVEVAKSDRINAYEEIPNSNDFKLADPIIPPAKEWSRAINTDSLEDRLERNVWGHTFTQSLTSPNKGYLYGGSSTVPKNMTVGAIIPGGRTSVWEVEFAQPPVWKKHWAVPDLTNENLAGAGSFTNNLYGGECMKDGKLIPISNCDVGGPSPRTGHSTHFVKTLTKGAPGSASSEVMFVFGGRSVGVPGTPGDCCNGDLWRLGPDPADASKRVWNQIDVSGGTFRPRLWFSQTVVYKGVLYAFSGVGGTSFSDDVPMTGVVGGSFELYALDLKPPLDHRSSNTLMD